MINLMIAESLNRFSLPDGKWETEKSFCVDREASDLLTKAKVSRLPLTKVLK